MQHMNYDPNLTCSGRMAKQVVRLTFGLWEYRKTMEVTVGGNCTGLTVIEAAIAIAYRQLEFRTVYGSRDKYAVIYMPHPEKDDELECDDDECWGDEWLGRMLISAEVVSITPDNE